MIGYIANHRGQGVVQIETRKSPLNKVVLYSIRNRFLDRGCRCGEDRKELLECHHTDPRTKEYNIGELIFVNCAPDLLLNELKKCEVICKQCHNLLHPERINLNEIPITGLQRS